MTFDPFIHHRQSLRLKGYDYSQSGAYFVTLCTLDRLCLFGSVVKDTVQLSNAGKMIQKIWEEMPAHYPGVEADRFIAMPNHVHGIIILKDKKSGQARGPTPTKNLADIIHAYKSYTTAQYRHGVLNEEWEPFKGRLWQRNYYEHVVRSEKELEQTREYILNNPMQWMMDEYYKKF